MQFEFATAGRILFGRGRIAELPDLVSEMGSRVFVVTGRQSPHYDSVVESLRAKALHVTRFFNDREPTTDLVLTAVQMARAEQSDVVVGIGGGSIIDLGKAVSAMLTNPGEILDYLEVVGKGQKLQHPTAPYIAVPTTAGTGAEVTRNAVLGSPQHRVKVSMRSPWLLPDIALVDPEMTFGLPPEVTVNSGLDALTQLIEAYVSNQANPLTDGICLEGIKLAARSLPRVYQNGQDPLAREDMSIAATFSGLALANAKLGAVHGFAGPLGGLYHAPHGGICARLLPLVMEANVEFIGKYFPDSPAMARFDRVAQILTEKNTVTARDGVTWINKLCETLPILPLSDYGMLKSDIPQIVEQAKKASSMKGNPVLLPENVLQDILERAL